VALALTPVALLAQEAARITGRVTNAQGQPEAGVLVRIQSLNVGATTDPAGEYALVVPGARIRAGQTVQLTATRQGLGTVSRSVTLAPGQALAQNFTMATASILLDEVVVTGMGTATERAKLPITVAQVTAEDMPVAATDAASMIQGKVTGATIVSGSGRPGSTPSILLRAPTMINATGRSQEPMYIVDGVILSGSTVDIDALDIESIEVVKGAAAASLYGSRASSGVIQIRTRSGRDVQDQSIRYTLRTEVGGSQLSNRIQIAQYHPWKLNSAGTKFVTSAGTEFNWGDRAANGTFLTPTLAGADIWTTFQVNRWPGGTYDHVDTFFKDGTFLQQSISAEGRQGRTNFLASLSNLNEGGVIIEQPGLARQSFRLNLDQELRENLEVSARSYYSRSSLGRFDESSGSPLFNLTRMPAGVDITRRDSATGQYVIQPDVVNTDNDNPLEQLTKREQTDARERFLGSVNVRFAPYTWWDVAGDLSYDRSTVTRSDFFPVGFQTARATRSLNNGYVYKDGLNDQAINSSLTTTFRRQIGDLAASAQARYLYEASDADYFRASSYNLAVTDIPQLGAGGTEGKITRSSDEEVRSEGVYGIVNLDFRDRYILDGLVRRDGSSLFGPEERWQTYYRLAGAWRISEEPFWSGLRGSFEDVKLRYSVGTAGGRPNYYAQYETYNVVDGTVTPVALGNTGLKPEFVIEREAGLDVVAFGRFNVSAVYARTEARDQILRIPLPAASGFTQQWQNAGTLKSNTLELTLDTRVIDRGPFSWNMRVGYDATRQRITKLNVPEYQAGFPLVQGLERVFYIREGEPLGAIYGTKFATGCGDLPSGVDCGQFAVNDDGYLVFTGGQPVTAGAWSPNFVTLPDNRQYFWGTPFAAVDGNGNTFQRIGKTAPDANWRLSNTFRLGGLSLYALLDATTGVDVYNLPRHWATFQRYSDIVDQVGKPQENQKPVGYYAALYRGLTPNSAFVEDGSFVKLREVSLRYRFGARQLSSLPLVGGMQSLSFNLTGRNLHTWTKYTGYDPEVGFAGGDVGSAAIARFDGFNYPQSRTMTLGVELAF
jgi:TonB-linked SusC/RagA family outer membrane protein